MFCLDGRSGVVVTGPAFEEPATAILNTSGSPSEAATRAQVRNDCGGTPADKNHDADVERVASSLGKVFDDRACCCDRPFSEAFLPTAILVRWYHGRDRSTPSPSAVREPQWQCGNRLLVGRVDRLVDLPLLAASNIKVSPTSSVMQYKGKPMDVAQVAKDLGWMLSCRVGCCSLGTI
jgi:hypothetical protein